MKFLALAFILCSISYGRFLGITPSQAAHVAGCWVIQDVTYEVITPKSVKLAGYDHGFGILSSFMAFAICSSKEYLIDSQPDFGDIKSNGLGAFGRHFLFKIPLDLMGK